MTKVPVEEMKAEVHPEKAPKNKKSKSKEKSPKNKTESRKKDAIQVPPVLAENNTKFVMNLINYNPQAPKTVTRP